MIGLRLLASALVAAALFASAAYSGSSAPELGRVIKAPVVPPKPLDGDEAMKKAKVDGKYGMLLAQIKVEDDWNTYGEFKELGPKGRRDYKGHKNVPRGIWVYVFPYWYVWRDETANLAHVRSWGPEQATGEPNAAVGSDSSAAWASLTEDGQDEWLLLEYAEAITPKTVEIHETYCPGAVVKITAFKLDGSEVEIWKGNDPTAAGNGSGISKMDVKADFKTTRIKVYIDSKNVAGWNEIDAVGIHDDKKKLHWAVACDASSTYAAQNQPQEDPKLKRLEDKIDALEAEIEEMRKTIKDLKEKLEKAKG